MLMSKNEAGVAQPAGDARAGAPLAGSVSFLIVLLVVNTIVIDIQGSAVLPVIGAMSADLDLSASQTAWALNALGIAAAVSTGLAARYADIVGHKRVLVPLLAVGIVGCVLSALADSFVVLTIGRALTGVAVSAPMVAAMLKVRATAEDMQRAARLNATFIAICTPLALVLGGLLIEAGAAWSAIFWVVAAGYLVMLIQVLAVGETPVVMRTSVKLDVIGAIGLAGWVVCLLLGLTQGPEWGWGSLPVVSLLVGSAVLFAAWVAQQRGTSHALMDFRGMDKRQVGSGYLCYCGIAWVASGLYILVPAYAQTPSEVGYGFGSDVLESSLILLPILPASLLARYVSKRLLERHGPRAPMAFGGLVGTAAFLWAAFMHSEQWMLYVAVALYGLGIVICFGIGWGLVAAAGRQDNMSITFGVQYSIALPTAALATAVTLIVMASAEVPGVPVPSEGTYQANFLLLAGVAMVTLVLNALFIVPKQLRDHSEGDGGDVVGLIEPVPAASTAG